MQVDVIRQKLEETLVDKVSGLGPQWHVEEIYIKEPASVPATDAIKVRHILYSPKNLPSGAASLDPNDPAGNAAQDKARATTTQLKEHPRQFDYLTPPHSDEGRPECQNSPRGTLPYFA